MRPGLPHPLPPPPPDSSWQNWHASLSRRQTSVISRGKPRSLAAGRPQKSCVLLGTAPAAAADTVPAAMGLRRDCASERMMLTAKIHLRELPSLERAPFSSPGPCLDVHQHPRGWEAIASLLPVDVAGGEEKDAAPEELMGLGRDRERPHRDGFAKEPSCPDKGPGQPKSPY